MTDTNYVILLLYYNSCYFYTLISYTKCNNYYETEVEFYSFKRRENLLCLSMLKQVCQRQMWRLKHCILWRRLEFVLVLTSYKQFHLYLLKKRDVMDKNTFQMFPMVVCQQDSKAEAVIQRQKWRNSIEDRNFSVS